MRTTPDMPPDPQIEGPVLGTLCDTKKRISNYWLGFLWLFGFALPVTLCSIYKGDGSLYQHTAALLKASAWALVGVVFFREAKEGIRAWRNGGE